LIYDALDYDVVLVSREYAYMVAPQTFPRRRVYQALGHPQVARSVPFYIGGARWKNQATGALYGVMVFGADPDKQTFQVPSITRSSAALKQMDTAIVDKDTRPRYGVRHEHDIVEINGRAVEILDQYKLGTAFVEQSMVVVSDQNFVRIMPERSLDDVTLGLVCLNESADPHQVASELKEMLPDDVSVYTRDEFRQREVRHWMVLSSTGFIFGSGVLVAFVVGTVILYQTVSTQITNKLSEYATLKAMGYGGVAILRVVLEQACMFAFLSFVPGLLVSLFLYRGIAKAAFLPMVMTGERVLFVLVLVLVMATFSGLLAYRKIHLADPADLF
jgi:putative ABC transport system permease protein